MFQKSTQTANLLKCSSIKLDLCANYGEKDLEEDKGKMYQT